MDIVNLLSKYLGLGGLTWVPETPRKFDFDGTIIKFDELACRIEATASKIDVKFSPPFPQFETTILFIPIKGVIKLLTDITESGATAETDKGTKKINFKRSEVGFSMTMEDLPKDILTKEDPDAYLTKHN